MSQNPADIVPVLQKVSYLSSLQESALSELAEASQIKSYKPGEPVLSELETGDDVTIVLSGQGEVTVGGFSGRAPTVVGHIGPGDTVGEMAMFTGELRSATVVATEPMETLRIDGDELEELMRRHPAVARHFAQLLSERLRVVEETLARALNPDANVETQREVLRGDTGNGRSTGPLRKVVITVWKELVTSRKRDVAFVIFTSFIIALLATRGTIELTQHYMGNISPLLTWTRLGGVLLLCLSGFGALVWFRPAGRRVLAALFGIGLAFLFEQPSVWLTFDIFYKDVFTPDKNLTFDISVLYNRSEGHQYVIIAAALLFQAVYLRHFYLRIGMIVAARIGRWVRGLVGARPAPEETPEKS